MKKLLTIAALIGATGWAFGQGQVTFNNGGTTLMSTNNSHNGAATGATSFTLGSWVYALFVAPSTVTTDSGQGDANWTFTGSYATNTAAATGGRLGGGQPVVPGFATGTTASFLVRGWSSDVAGLDYTTARAWELTYESTGVAPSHGYWLESVIAQVAVGGGPNPIASVFGTTAGSSIPGSTFDLRPIPEPSTFALAGLGVATMLIFRRRKA